MVEMEGAEWWENVGITQFRRLPFLQETFRYGSVLHCRGVERFFYFNLDFMRRFWRFLDLETRLKFMAYVWAFLTIVNTDGVMGGLVVKSY